MNSLVNFAERGGGFPLPPSSQVRMHRVWLVVTPLQPFLFLLAINQGAGEATLIFFGQATFQTK